MDRRRGIERLTASSHGQENLLNTLKRVLLALVAGACIAIVSTVAAVDLPTQEEARALAQQHTDTVIETLLAEGTPRSLTLAATAMLPIGENAAVIGQRQRELFEQAATSAPDDAWIQWMAALNASSNGPISEFAIALQRLEPDNGAVWLFPLQAAARAKDSRGMTETLARIGTARSYQSPFVTTALEWLKFYRANPITPPPGFTVERSSASAFTMAVARAAAVAMTPNFAPMAACKSRDQPLQADRREACLSAGRLMLTQSNTLDSMLIGATLVRLAGAEDAAEITHNFKYFSQENLIRSKAALNDPAEFALYQADWVQTRNEVQVARNLLTRAGIPLLPPADWKSDPKAFMARMSAKNDG